MSTNGEESSSLDYIDGEKEYLIPTMKVRSLVDLLSTICKGKSKANRIPGVT